MSTELFAYNADGYALSIRKLKRMQPTDKITAEAVEFTIDELTLSGMLVLESKRAKEVYPLGEITVSEFLKLKRDGYPKGI